MSTTGIERRSFRNCVWVNTGDACTHEAPDCVYHARHHLPSAMLNGTHVATLPHHTDGGDPVFRAIHVLHGHGPEALHLLQWSALATGAARLVGVSGIGRTVPVSNVDVLRTSHAFMELDTTPAASKAVETAMLSCVDVVRQARESFRHQVWATHLQNNDDDAPAPTPVLVPLPEDTWFTTTPTRPPASPPPETAPTNLAEGPGSDAQTFVAF
jgi:hypothetical protein